MAQTALFQIVPDATKVVVDKLLKSTITCKGAKYNSTLKYIELDGTGGIYASDVGVQLAGGLQVEIVSDSPDLANRILLVKDKTVCLKVDSAKFKTDWLTGSLDAYNASTDQIFGNRQLAVNRKHTLRWSYDAETGMVVMTVDGVLDRKRYRFQGAGGINTDLRSSWQFLTGVKANVYSITVWSGKPNLVPAGMECYAIDQTLRFMRIDPAMVGADLVVVAENPNGASANNPSFRIPSAMDFSYIPTLDGLVGIHTLHLSAVKAGKVVWSAVKLMVNRAKPVLPTSFIKGMYHVPVLDFALVKSLGCTHVYSDQVMNANGGWKQVNLWLNEAQAAGLKMFVAASYHAKAASFAMAHNYTAEKEATPHPALAGWYSVDEAAGTFDRLKTNYVASRMASPQTPVCVDLNNFQRIEEAAECCDVLWVNVYLSPAQDRRKITDVVRKASALRPTMLVLPLYEGMNTPRADLVDMARLGKEAGAIGIFIFEMEQGSWRMSPEQLETVKAVFASVG